MVIFMTQITFLCFMDIFFFLKVDLNSTYIYIYIYINIKIYISIINATTLYLNNIIFENDSGNARTISYVKETV